MKIYSNILPGTELDQFLGDEIKLAFDTVHEADYFDGMVMDLTTEDKWNEDNKYELTYPKSAFYSVLVVLEEYVRNGAELIKIN